MTNSMKTFCDSSCLCYLSKIILCNTSLLTSIDNSIDNSIGSTAVFLLSPRLRSRYFQHRLVPFRIGICWLVHTLSTMHVRQTTDWRLWQLALQSQKAIVNFHLYCMLMLVKEIVTLETAQSRVGNSF